jgi:molybdopterin-binding protein
MVGLHVTRLAAHGRLGFAQCAVLRRAWHPRFRSNALAFPDNHHGECHEDQRTQSARGHGHRALAGSGDDEVEIEVGPDTRIVATITRSSTRALGLAVGKPAFALIKASSVLIATDVDDVKLSSRNQLRGTVSAVRPGAVNAEVDLDIGGKRIAAIVTIKPACAGAGSRQAGARAVQGIERDRRHESVMRLSRLRVPRVPRVPRATPHRRRG